MAFVRFLGIEWPASATSLLSATVKDVQAFRDLLIENKGQRRASKTYSQPNVAKPVKRVAEHIERK